MFNKIIGVVLWFLSFVIIQLSSSSFRAISVGVEKLVKDISAEK